MIKTSAPGKLILFGEHAVVYGEAAIATAINKRAFVTAEKIETPKIVIERKNPETQIEVGFHEDTTDPVVRAVQESLKKINRWEGIKLEIDSQIPLSVGMGSTSSILAATSSAVLNLFEEPDVEDVVKIAHEAEKAVYDKPSGINTAVSALGGTIYFQRGHIEPIRTEPIEIVVGNAGSRKNTRALIEDVRKRVEDPRVSYNLFTIGSIVRQARKAIFENNLKELGNLMNKNHYYLRELGVSSVELERLVETARAAGAYGAKLTGAGGGGCIIALTDDPERVIEALNEKGADAFLVKTHQGGVRKEQTNEYLQ